MDRTLDLLGDKVDPKAIWDGLIDILRGGDQPGSAAQSTFRAVTRPIRENPLATIGLGVSAIWLIAGSGDDDPCEDGEYDDTYDDDRYHLGSQSRDRQNPPLGRVGASDGGRAPGDDPHDSASPGNEEGIGEKLKGAGEAAKEKLADVGDAVSDKIHAVGDAASAKADLAKEHMSDSMKSVRVRSRKIGQRGSRVLDDASARIASLASDTKTRYRDGLRENPLGLLVGALGLGVLAGVAIPVSRREEELYGEYSDEITDDLKETGEELVEKGKRVGARAAEVALDEVDQATVDTDGLSDIVDDVKTTVADAASRVADEATEAADEEGLTPEQLEEKAKNSKSPGTGPTN